MANLPPKGRPSQARHAGIVPHLASIAAASAPPAPPPLVSIGAVTGRFFHNSSYANGTFDVNPTTPPLFTQQFTAIDFNPPTDAQVSCTNNTGVYQFTRPMADVIPQPDGSCLAQTVQGNGYQAGATGSSVEEFEAVFTAQLTVVKAGPVIFNFYSDDGWVFAMGLDGQGDQPAYAGQGPLDNAPPAGPFTVYRVVGSYNHPSSPARNQLTVSFPAAGTYPIELDYTEASAGELAITLGTTYGNPILPATISSLPGDQGRNTDHCPCAQPSTSNPVNTRTGNYWTDATDLLVSSPGPSLEWVRTSTVKQPGTPTNRASSGMAGKSPTWPISSRRARRVGSRASPSSYPRRGIGSVSRISVTALSSPFPVSTPR